MMNMRPPGGRQTLQQPKSNMQRKQNALACLVKVGVCAVLALGAIAAQAQDKVDANGTWKWTGPARGGGDPPEMSLKLKVDGEKVTGSLTAPGRGGDPVETQISDGKLTGNQLSFNIVREGRNGGPSSTNKYEGKIMGDTIKGTQTAPPRRGRGGMGGGNGGGAADAGGTPPAPPAPTPRPWEATRAK
jgi:hypothetical protein